jgi:hypothetical protein
MSLANLKSPFATPGTPPPDQFDPTKIALQMQTDPTIRANFAQFFGDPASRHFVQQSGNVLDALSRPDNPWTPGAPVVPNAQPSFASAAGPSGETGTAPGASLASSPAAVEPGATQAPGMPPVYPGAHEYAAAHPEAVMVPPRPVAPMDNVHGARKALLLAFLGLNKFGAGLDHQQNSYADEFLGRQLGQSQAQSQYDTSAPQLKHQAEEAAYNNYLGQQTKVGELEHAAAETRNLQANLPLQNEATKEYENLLGHWQNRDVPDFGAYANARLAGMPPAIAQIVRSRLGSIYQIPQTGKGYTVNMQDDLPTSINVYGKDYDPKDPALAQLPVGPAAIADFNRAAATHQTKRGEVRADEDVKAQHAAEAQARAFAQQKTMEQQKNLDAIKKEGDEADQSYQSIVSLSKQNTGAGDNAIIDQFFNLAKPTSGARMNEAQMLRLQNFGSLETRARQWANNVSQGARLLPEQRTEIINAAKVLRDVKVEAVHDNLFVLGGQGGTEPGIGGGGQQGKVATSQHIADYAAKKYPNDPKGVEKATAEFKSAGYTIQ